MGAVEELPLTWVNRADMETNYFGRSVVSKRYRRRCAGVRLHQ